MESRPALVARASKDLSARLQFMQDSAHLLLPTAPHTSRYLMAQHDSLMFNNELPPPAPERRKACGSCGTIILLGWEGILRMESTANRKRRSSAKNPKPTSNTMVYQCGTCSMKTRQSIQPASDRQQLDPLSALSSQQSTTPASLVTINTNSTPASNKKRAKSKKRSGLEAILATKKTKAIGPGLGLMDFMKKS